MRIAMLRRRAFTLVELLVVVGIISLLVAFLLPSLNKARERAKDIACAATMRQTLMAVMMYNNQYKMGLQNYHPSCQYWGQGWASGKAGAHWLAGNIPGQSYRHLDAEGRGANSFWRGYLLLAHFAGTLDKTGACIDSHGLGCPYQSFAKSSNILLSLTGTGVTQGNQVELAPGTAATLRDNPPYIWLGPGILDWLECMIWQGEWNGPLGGDLPAGNDGKFTSYKHYGPLICCPTIVHYFANVNDSYEPTHRPQWTIGRYSGLPLGYAQNVGYTDGSVKFFISRTGGFYNAMK
jgi:prepilin-type N-terminal cleavage/methylation domain-containing protein